MKPWCVRTRDTKYCSCLEMALTDISDFCKSTILFLRSPPSFLNFPIVLCVGQSTECSPFGTTKLLAVVSHDHQQGVRRPWAFQMKTFRNFQHQWINNLNKHMFDSILTFMSLMSIWKRLTFELYLLHIFCTLCALSFFILDLCI